MGRLIHSNAVDFGSSHSVGSMKESSVTWDGFISGSNSTSLGHVVYSIAHDLQVKNSGNSISLAILYS